MKFFDTIRSMEQIIVYCMTGLLGAMFGSFAGAQVWRLRARQLAEDKKAGEKVDAKELKRLKPLLGKNIKTDRSRCLSCGHELKWYDLLPIAGWIMLGGKCRYCRKPIGYMEILLELALACLFVLSVVLWPGNLLEPLQITLLIVWLTGLVLLAVLFVYDFKWLLLPDIVNLPFIAVAAVSAVIRIATADDWQQAAWSLLAAMMILSGLYFALYLFSKMRYGEDKTWVGFGDVKLGLGLALFLAEWQLAFIGLFAANLIGTILILPALLTRKVKANTRVSFGPLLIGGFLVAWFLGGQIIDYYQTLMY